MNLHISDFTTARQWRAALGADQARLEKVLVLCTASYGDLCGHSVAHRPADLEVTPSLQAEPELVFFPLFSLKAGFTDAVVGFVSGRDAANAQRNQPLGLHVLEQSLRPAHGLPQRTVANAAEFADYCQPEETLICDGIEQRSQRPREHEAQKDPYSGNKRPPPHSGDAEHSDA